MTACEDVHGLGVTPWASGWRLQMARYLTVPVDLDGPLAPDHAAGAVRCAGAVPSRFAASEIESVRPTGWQLPAGGHSASALAVEWMC